MPRICHRHNIGVVVHGECPKCVAELANPRPVPDMSPEERLAEFESWIGDDVTLEVEIDRIIPRLNALVGRSLFVPEFAGDGLRLVLLKK